MPLLNRLFRAILFSVCVITTSFGQVLPSKNYTTANGLSNNAVRCLFTDLANVLWIGTENGVSRMENGAFYTIKSTNGLGFDNCWDITQDTAKNMWFASYGGGVSKYDGTKFTIFTTKTKLPSNKTRKVFAYKDKIYVGTELGVAVIDIYRNTVIIPKDIQPHFNVFIVTDFFVRNSEVYFSTVNEGLYKIGKKNNIIIPVKGYKHAYSLGSFQDTLYSSNKGYINKFRLDDTSPSFDDPVNFGTSLVWDYARDTKNNLYAAAWGVFKNDGGLYKITGNTMLNISAGMGVGSPNLLALAYNKKTDVLYAGSKDKGIYEIQLNNGVVYYPFNDAKITDFEAVGDTQYLLHSKGLSILSGENNVKTINALQFKNFEHRYINTHKKLPEHKDGYYELDYSIPASGIEFYELVKQGSLFYVNTNIGIFKVNYSGSILGYMPLHSYKIGFTSGGKLIETIPYAGTRVYNDEDNLQAKHFSEFEKSTPTDIVKILNHNNKTYLISVFRGLFEYDGKAFRSYLDEKLWNEEKLKFITKNDAGQLIIAAEFGDVFIADVSSGFKIIKKIPRKKLTGTTITFLEAYKDYIFIGTERGINIYHNGTMRLLDADQGLKDYSITASRFFGGKLWLGTANGYYVLNAAVLLQPQPTVSSVKISAITVNNIPVATTNHWFYYKGNRFTQDYTHNTIGIDIVPSGHVFPGKLKYRYRLNESGSWSPYSYKPYLYLPYLPHGRHVAQLQIFDANTGKTSMFNVLYITITPPFWLSWWFIALSALLAVGLALLTILRYKKRVAEKAAIQKRIVETRLEALLGQMNPHFTFNAMNAIQNFIICNDVDKSLLYVSKLAWLMRQTLENSSRQSISLTEEIDFLEAYIEIENMRFGNRINYTLNIQDTIEAYVLQLPAMLLQPFVENVFVHAFNEDHPNPELSIYFTLTDGMLQCTIKDNGVGAATLLTNKLHTSKGIGLTRERLKLLQPHIHNALTITHSISGTIVIITLQT